MEVLLKLLRLIFRIVLNLINALKNIIFHVKKWFLIQEMHRTFRKAKRRHKMKYIVKFANFLKNELKKHNKPKSIDYVEYTKRRIDNYVEELNFEKLLVIYCELFPHELKNIEKYFRYLSPCMCDLRRNV